MKRSFYDRNAQKILLVSAFLVIPTFAGAFRALKSNKNDVSQWLPSQYEETTTFKWFRRHFAGEQFILMSWDGCTLNDDRLRLMVGKLDPQHHPTHLDAATEGEPEEVAGDNPQYFKEAITGKDLLTRLTSDPANLTDEEALARLKGTLIGPNGRTTCVLVTLTEDGKEHMRDCVNLVRRTAAECNIQPAELHMGGPPVDNVAIDEAGEQSLYRLAGFAAMIGLAISWWCLRNVKLIAIVFFTGIYGAAASLAIVRYSPLLWGEMPGWISVNAILLTMPSLVYVATISGAIHLSNYYRDLLEEGVDIAVAPEKAIRHAWLPLTLATATTSVGLWTLCYSEVVPIQLFGLYSGIGVVVSALLLFFHVPAALQVWPLREFSCQAAVHRHEEAHEQSALSQALGAFWHRIGDFIIRRNLLVAFGCLALLTACGWGMVDSKTSVHLMRLFPPDAKILADYKWLELNLGDLVPMEVILKIDPQQCRLDFLEKMELVERIQQKLEQTGEVGGVLTAVTFSPHLPRPEEFRKAKSNPLIRIAVRDPYRTARRVTAKKLLEHRDEYIKGDYLAIEDDGKELWRISARVGALNDVDYGDILAGIRQHVEPVLTEVKQDGVEGIQPVYTGLVPLIYKAQRSLLQGLVWGFVSDFVLITIVMMIAVRDFSAGVILALPSIFPAVMVFGVMGWAGIVIDIGTVMAPSVALGVTVDDVVHFMIQYRGGLKAGLNRRESVMLAYKGCARAMYQSWGVIGLGMSVFAFSPFTPTQRFGYMMVTLLTSALIGNLLLLPALLAGPLGSLFGRRYTRARKAPAKPIEQERPAPAGVRLHAAEAVHTDHVRRGIKA